MHSEPHTGKLLARDDKNREAYLKRDGEIHRHHNPKGDSK
jgi:hypothetical protein